MIIFGGGHGKFEIGTGRSEAAERLREEGWSGDMVTEKPLKSIHGPQSGMRHGKSGRETWTKKIT